MSNVAAILKGRSIRVSDGVYLERAHEREFIAEEYLRALVARLPKLKSRARNVRKFVANANSAEQELQAMNDQDLIADLKQTCIRMRQDGMIDRLLARAFAAVREASRRTLKMRHHDVQLIGGWAMLQGMIAEMETGEGKTLVATLVACTAAAAGASVHVITVNDYLAERDAELNMPLYEFCGLKVGVIVQGMSPEQRREKYACDVVYVSNKEVVFDYLKDRIATGEALATHYRLRHLYRSGQQPSVLMRGLHVAIVDEADSILIDEARTPLIISETVSDANGEDLYHTSLALARRLQNGVHFGITEHREVWLSKEGERFIGEMVAGLEGVWTSSLWRNELLQKALTALWCYERDQHYIVQEGKVEIVDEFSGRVMPDRSWESGLHQMIEAKEGCEITGQRKTLSRMTYQRFLGRYLLLCGMTGTAAEVMPELKRVYDLEVFRIPTRLPATRRRLPNQYWMTSEQRWEAVALRAIELSRSGAAVLVGTRSVEASEALSERLRACGVAHAVLNARNDKEEAEIVARAGQPGNITISTNMAGRGTDIKPSSEVLDRGGLHVILTEFHESARVDRQLFGRSARQGQPGRVQAMVSLEDDLFRRYAPFPLAVARRISSLTGEPPRWLVNRLVDYAQFIAEKHNAGIRMSTLKQDKKLQSQLAFSGGAN
jgi:preprotein translocase subunit SecA